MTNEPIDEIAEIEKLGIREAWIVAKKDLKDNVLVIAVPKGIPYQPVSEEMRRMFDALFPEPEKQPIAALVPEDFKFALRDREAVEQEMLQKLMLSHHLMPLAASGEKKGTSRRGRRNIALGPLVLEDTDGIDDNIVVDVISVTYTKLKDIPQEIVESEGYQNLDELISVLKTFYPDCDLEDEFTVVSWA
jgi:hypothetical protein